VQKPPSHGIGVKFLVSSAALVVIFAGIKAASGLIAPVLLSIFLALILTPPLRWLKQKGLPEFFAIFTLAAVVFLLGLCIVLISTHSLTRFADRLPEYAEKVNAAYNTIDDWLNDVADRFHSIGESISSASFLESEKSEEESELPIDSELEIAPIEERVRERLSLSDYIDTSTLMSHVRYIVDTLLNVLTMGSLVIILLVFKLVEAARMPDKVKEAFGGRDLSSEYFKKIADDTWNYMKLKTIICILTGAATSIGLWFLGVEYALLWGLLMFFCNYIPNIGQFIAGIPPVLLSLLDGGLSLALWATLWLVVVNVFFGLVLEPRYMGNGLGISVLVVFLSLLFWGWLLGPIGMFLSAPLTMVVKIVLQNDEKTRWIAVLLSNR